VLLRVRNMLETRGLHQELSAYNQELEDRVRSRTQELEEARNETLERLAVAAEYRDDETGQHTRRVGEGARLIAWQLGLGDADSDLIGRAARLHDIGKIAVPDEILLKPAKLTTVEFEVVKTHTTIGAKILSGSGSALLQTAEEIAWAHHERWDGNGYAGVTGPEIPLVGRITTVADVFDALTHARPYKEAWPIDQAVEEMTSQREKMFDPEAVDAFMQVLDPMIAMSQAEAEALR
jgi:putative two-component system response regulator